MNQDSFTPAATAATKALGVLLKECQKVDPDGPSCDAVTNAIKMVGEIEGQYGQANAGQAGSIADAVGQLHQATMAGAAGPEPPVA